MTSPTVLTLKHLAYEGWTAQKVEQDVPHARTKRDLFGFVDVLAVRGGQTLAVQTTTTANQAARVKKVLASEHLAAVRAAGWLVHVHGWHLSMPRRHWVLTTTDLTTDTERTDP